MIHVGVSGWSYPDWEGIVYPKPRPRGFDPILYLGRFVDFLEINTSFYAVPARAHCERWARSALQSPTLFFTAKLQRGLTHEWRGREARELEGLAAGLSSALQPLREASLLRALLAQFPFSFQAGEAEQHWLVELSRFFAGDTLAIELRHRSWYAPERLLGLRSLGLSIAEIDMPDASSPPPPASQPDSLAYLRLHGRNTRAWFDPQAGRDQKYDYMYGLEELRGIAQRAQRLASNSSEVLLATNNHFSGKAVANALELLGLLRERPIAVPEVLLSRYPDLAHFARPPGQAELF